MNPLVVAAADYFSGWDTQRVGQLTQGTLTFAMRMRGAGRTGIAIEGGLAGEPRWQLWVTAQGLAVCAAWHNGWRRHDVPVSGLDDGAWHTVIVTSGSGRVRVWVDHDLIYQAPGEAWFADSAAKPGGLDTLVVGRSLDGERLMGEIADATFYREVFIHDQALKVLEQPIPFSTSALVNHDGISYRIPALASVEGTLVLVADRRHNGPGDAPNVIDLVCQRSTDGGRTWGDASVIVPPFEGGASTDACLLYDQSTGTLWALFSAYAPGSSQPAVLRGDPGAEALIQAVASTDAGQTWQTPVTVTPTNANPAVRCLGVSPGAGAVMHDGTLVIPAYHEVDDGEGGLDFAATVLTSRDHGQSWQVGQPIWADGHPTYESTVFEGNPGDIVLMARNQHPSGKVLRATSNEYGNAWDNVDFLADVPEIFSQPASTPLPDGRIAFCNPSALLPYRGWGVVRASSDGGVTWPYHRTLNADRHGYQSMAVLPDGQLVVAWEHEWDSIDVTVCPPDWLHP
ncbi:sialidase family protein [Stomatohabitans albus]|uniref:sialidase family protein n=1 Tax=Stomatohabitans albus TaxID=3110766 RepID=UPI00300D8331